MTDPLLVSIIIRARNEEAALRRLVPLLRRQQTDFAWEVWLLDNASTDGTLAFACEHNLHYHVIPEGTFNYATALNLGATLARGAIVVNLSAHCFPTSVHWLAQLVAPLRDDPQVVASYGSQRTDPRFNPFEAQGNAALYPLDGKQPAIVAFSNSNCAIRRDVVRHHPFNPLVKALEDHLFYLELRDELRFVYVPEALVQHDQEGLSRASLRRWQTQGWAIFFMRRHRGLRSPLLPSPLVSRQNLVRYVRSTGGFLLRGQFRAALLMLPTHLARDAMCVVGWLKALRSWRRIRVNDAALQVYSNRVLLRECITNERQPPHDWSLPYEWVEEWQFHGNWSFIRRNVEQFIRACHERGYISSPLLEVGASGQNDYLRAFYAMRTSNRADNRQNADEPLDMEDMHAVADDSLGTVLCSEVLEHVYHPERAVAEAFRVLRPSGTLIVTVPYNIMIHNAPADGGFHGRNFTPQGIELLLREVGFVIELLETRGESVVRERLMPSNVFIIGRKPS